ncbi:TPA: cell division protein FtsL [Streptococcus suis]|nr:cell division protein FtsL [Streptococcus suis]
MVQEKSREAAMRVIGERFKTFSRIEKAFYSSIVISGLALAVGIIFMQARLLQVQSDLAKVNQDINQKQVELNDSKQAKNELTRSARLMEIAEKVGLTFNNDNIGVAE